MSTRLNPWGFVVLEACEEYEQILSLDIGNGKPPGGVLTWATGGKYMRCFFPTRKIARAAITRTDNYSKAFGLSNLPEAKNCRIEFIAAVEEV
jgi:hypothetical protein